MKVQPDDTITMVAFWQIFDLDLRSQLPILGLTVKLNQSKLTLTSAAFRG